jgi:hypothetical protein
MKTASFVFFNPYFEVLPNPTRKALCLVKKFLDASKANDNHEPTLTRRQRATRHQKANFFTLEATQPKTMTSRSRSRRETLDAVSASGGSRG